MARLLGSRARVISTCAAVLLALAASPVASADTSVRESGTRGAHSLRDSSGSPGVTCKYRTFDLYLGYWEGWLRRLNVQPPRVWAAAGTQQVGWRFKAQRKRNNGAWQTTYTSPTSRATATLTVMASFSSKSINVVEPNDAGLGPDYRYRVRVEMFWYNPSGSVTGKSVHMVNYYQRNYPDGFSSDERGVCHFQEFDTV